MITKFFNYKTDIGFLTISETDGKITELTFGKEDRLDSIKEETNLIFKTLSQIEEYLKGNRKRFDIPLSLSGTEFQLKVWKALQEIPYGETRSYKEIAQMIGNPRGCRAVGNANNKNPISIIVP